MMTVPDAQRGSETSAPADQRISVAPGVVLRPVMPLASEESRYARTIFQCAGVLISLVLHAGAAAAMLVWLAPAPGAVPEFTEAISVEIITSEVAEAVENSPPTSAAAAASATDAQAGSTVEAPAQQKVDEVAPASTEPPPRIEEAATAEPAREVSEVPETHQAEPHDIAPPDARMPAEDLPAPAPAVKRDEARLDVVPEGDVAAARSPERSKPAPSADNRPAALPRVRSRTDRVQPSEDARPTPTRRKTKASAPSRKGGNPSRAARHSGTTAARASASRGAAINYAAIVRARVAARRPSGHGQRGSVYITFGVSPSGGLAFASVSRSSGDPSLDRSVLAAVRGAAPFPAPPAGASLRQRQFSIPFHFQ